MDSSEFTDPDNTTRIEQTNARVRNKRIALVGEGRFFWVLVVLLAAVIVLDTFGLPRLMRLSWVHQNAPMFFRSICDPNTLGPSGGFAWALIGLLILTMSALQFIAPRNVNWGFAFFVITAVFCQYYIAKNSSIANVMESGLIGEIWDVRIDCGTAQSVPREQAVNFRYDPEGVEGQGSADVPIRFTTMLVANLGLLAIFTAITFGCSLVAAIFRILKRPAKQDGPIGGIFGYIARGPVERAILVQTAILSFTFVIAGPLLVMLFALDPISGQGGTDFTKAVNDLLWIGPAVFLADLARVALFAPEPETNVNSSRNQADEDVDTLFLPQVLNDLCNTFGARISSNYALQPSPSTKRVPASISASDFAEDTDIPALGNGNLHFETLTDWHYDLIVEVMNRRVFDRGRTALLICPVDVVGSVHSAMTKGFAKNPGHNVVTWWCFGNPLPEDQDMNLILVTPESLEALAAQVFEYRDFFHLLGGVFILNLHKMDLGLLHISLRRLERHVASPSDMVAILQSEIRRKMPDWSKNLPLLVQMTDIRRKTRPEVNEAIPQHVTFLAPKAAENFAAGIKNWPIGPRALLHVAKSESRALSYFFDINTQHVRSFWADTIMEALRNDGNIQAVQWGDGICAPVLVPEHHEHPVALLMDTSNLVNLLGSDVGTPGALESLRLVSVGGYPGASFLMDKIAQAMSSASSDSERREAITQLQGSYCSIAPAPVGGPIELALMIRQEFLSVNRAKTGQYKRAEGYKSLTQERISTMWDKSSPALKQLQISNTKAGLEKLFRVMLQTDSEQKILSASQTEHRSYEYALTSVALGRVNALTTLELSIQNQKAAEVRANRPERLLLSDYGLSYANDTRLALGGRIYKVVNVDARHRKLHVRYDEEVPALPNTFVRDYGILTASPEDSSFAADTLSSWLNRKCAHEIATGYLQAARRTRAFYEHHNLWTPFDGKTNAPNSTSISAESALQLRSSCILRLLAPVPTGPRRRVLSKSVKQGAIRGTVAFTLVTTLQDVLHMCFPANAHRIAVLSPESRTVNGRGSLEEFTRNRQPRLATLDVQGRTVHSGSGAEHVLTSLEVGQHRRLAEMFFERARNETREEGHKRSTQMHLFIVEDSDHDLGVAKALSDDNTFVSVVQFWRDFVAHCAADSSDNSRAAYAFGADQIASCYDFIGALSILDDMIAEDA